MTPALVFVTILLTAVEAVGWCGAFVFTYNRTFAKLHESKVKKLVAFAMLPAGCMIGLACALALGTSLGDALNGVGFAFAVATMRHALRQRRVESLDARRAKITQTRLRPGADIGWSALGFLETFVLRLAAPWNQPTALRVKTYRVRVPDLPAEFDGYRVLHMTDFHIHRTLTDAYYRSSVDAANDLAPDLILLGGDYITKATHIARVHELLAGLKSKDGILAIRGNHDFWTQPDAVAKELAQIGARVLSNECATVSRGESELRIVGIEAPFIPLSHREMVVLITEGRPHIALIHTPDAFPLAEELGAAVALAGHTHGGQVRLPFFGTTLSSTTMGAGYAYGSNRLGRMLCITSAGVGSFVPLRLFCPPEMILLQLAR